MFCFEPSLNSEWYINSLLDRCHDNKSFQNLHQEQLGLYLFKYGSYAEMLCSNEDYNTVVETSAILRSFCWYLGSTLIIMKWVESTMLVNSPPPAFGETLLSLSRFQVPLPQCAYSLSTWCQDFPGFFPPYLPAASEQRLVKTSEWGCNLKSLHCWPSRLIDSDATVYISYTLPPR